MAATLTPWFPIRTKPVRDGVYQMLIGDSLKYACWRDGYWSLAVFDFKVAKNMRSCSYDAYSESCKGWRGLAEEPK